LTAIAPPATTAEIEAALERHGFAPRRHDLVGSGSAGASPSHAYRSGRL
jgi:hypothetical protein